MHLIDIHIYLPPLSCRLYSDYLYFGIANKSAEDFHEKVSESLQLFEGCLTEYTMRSCVYNTTVNNAMPVSVPSLLLLCCSPVWNWHLATSLLACGKVKIEKGVKKGRWSEIHGSLAHVKACRTDFIERDWQCCWSTEPFNISSLSLHNKTWFSGAENFRLTSRPSLIVSVSAEPWC